MVRIDGLFKFAHEAGVLADDFSSLSLKLADLEKSAQGAPLVSVASGVQPQAEEWREQEEGPDEVLVTHSDASDGEHNAGDWEML